MGRAVARYRSIVAGRRRRGDRLADRADARSQLLAAIVDSSDDAIVAKTLDGTITSWNAGAQRMYGYGAGEAIGSNIAMLVPGAGRADLADMLARVGRGERVDHHQTRRVCKDGTVLDVSVTVSPIRDDAGAIVAASTVARDISALKDAEAHRKELAGRSRRDERLQGLGQLAGGIAHDFNNLLAIIVNYSDFVAEQTAEDSSVHADALKIRVAADRASVLARQLLVFARGEPTGVEVFDLNSAIADARGGLVLALGEHIELVTVPSPAALMIRGDRGQIEQVLHNLALNARDAMPDGGTLVIETAVAEFDENPTRMRPTPATGRYARLLVSDTGAGMSREITEHIFEPFFTTRPRGHGTGMGLATVYGVVTQAGGSIDVYSEPHLGTTIRIYLPAAYQTSGPTGGQPAVPAPRGNGETILVVEDEDAIRQLVERVLGRNGYSAVTASRGPEALTLFAEHPCDLLITDVIMPEMSGPHLAGLVRKLCPDVLVLYMSGYSDGLLNAQRLLAQDADLLQKPFTARDLLLKVHTALTQRPGVPVNRGPSG